MLQGGTTAGGLVTGNTNGASVYQTGQIPVWAQSLYYVGRASQVTFNDQPLSIVSLGDFENVPQWGIIISGYAGQTGELRFTAPWHTEGSIDYLDFSTAVLPEPSSLTLATVFALCFLGIMRWPNNKKL